MVRLTVDKPLYQECRQCEEFFQLKKGMRLRKYCSRKCRDAAYYRRHRGAK